MPAMLSNNLLPSLPPTLIAQLFANPERIQLAVGQALFRSGDEGNGCYQLTDGVVKVVISSASAAERIIAILGPGAFLGELSMLDGLPRSASIIAIQDCKLLFVTRDTFKQYARTHPEVFEHLTTMLATRLRDTDELLAASSFLNIKARLARALLQLSRYLGKKNGQGQIEIAHRISQGDLAAMAGIARENVSRILTEWKQQKILTQSSQQYYLHDVAALEREVEFADS